MVVGDYSVAGCILLRVFRCLLYCSADFVAQDSAGAKASVYLFQVCAADSAGFHLDEGIASVQSGSGDLSKLDLV